MCNYAVRLFVCKFDSLHAICNYSESAHVFRCVRLCFSRVRDVQQMHIHVQSFSCELRCVCVCVLAFQTVVASCSYFHYKESAQGATKGAHCMAMKTKAENNDFV